jgi:hypothetical protein
MNIFISHTMSPKEICARLLRPSGRSRPQLLSRIKKVVAQKALDSWKCPFKLRLSLQSKL